MKNPCLLTVFVFLCAFSVVKAQEVSQWRGENSAGIYPVKNMMASWPATGPAVLWSSDALGEGHTSPVFANGKIYVTGMVDGKGVLFVLDKTGKRLSQFEYGKEWDISWPGTRSTVTIAGNLAYLYSGMGKLACLNLDNGKMDWTADLFTDYDGKNIQWGVTESVVVDGDQLFCCPGGKTNNVVALNRFTGKLIWSCPGLGEQSAYCTPLLLKLPARKLLVTMMANHILGIDAGTGRLLWSHEQTNRWSVHANTPLFYDGGLFCFSGYGQGGVKLKLSADGSSVTKEWFSTDFDCRMGGAVVIDGYIYGSGDNHREWMCIDWKTGETKYKSEEVNKGAVIAAGGKLIGYSEKGELFLAEVNSQQMKVLGNTKVELGTGPHWAHPVVNDGILYIRHGNALIAYKIS